MTDFEKINAIPITEVCDHLGITYQKTGPNEFVGINTGSKGGKDTSFTICTKPGKNYINDYGGEGKKGGPIDFVGRHILDVDTQTNEGRLAVVKWYVEQGLITPNNNFEKKKITPVKDNDLIENFDNYKLGGYKQEIKRFLSSRGVPFEFIEENHERIGEIFKNFGFFDSYYCTQKENKDSSGKFINNPDDKPKNVPVLMFPLLDNGYLNGAKLRRIDGLRIRGIKSHGIGRGGIYYEKIDKDLMYVVEGEPDYIIMRLLGFDNVLLNGNGITGNKDKIKELLFETKKIVFFYDQNVKNKIYTDILKFFSRQVYKVSFPESLTYIDSKTGKSEELDINNLYKAGYNTPERMQKFLAENTEEIIANNSEEDQPLYKDRFFFDDHQGKFFDVRSLKFKGLQDLSLMIDVKTNDIPDLKKNGAIPVYEGICYRHGGKKGYYNLLDKETILQPSDTPKAHEDLVFLISNLCNNNNQNINWLLKAIAYKYRNINDVIVPAVVFHGKGSTGKGLFVKLLAQIFGEENTQVGLTQDSIDSRFSSYSGQKLIVEFKELFVSGVQNGKKNMNKLKTFIMEDKIMIERKGQDPITTDNIAWFIMSSNEAKPIQLDAEDSGNRRFSIIKTGEVVDRDKGGKIANTINNKQNVRDFLAWLLKQFPEGESITALDNEDKRILQEYSETVGNLFFKWFEDKYPDINIITNRERDVLLDHYRLQMGEDADLNDVRYLPVNFNNGLSNRYAHGILKKIHGKNTRVYKIDKMVKGTGYFPNNYIEKNFDTSDQTEEKE